MKFPLPADTFPKVSVSAEDAAALAELADLFVQEKLVQYHEHLVVNHQVVNPNQWKKVRQRGGISVYRERSDEATSLASATIGAANTNGLVMPVLMALGTIKGDLDDVMFGVLNPTTESMKIKSSYAEEGFVDSAVLASLIKPTLADPLRSLSLRWMVKRNPAIITPIVWIRDTVYMESTGVALTRSGERIGYQLLHSVQLPGIHELKEHRIVRANVSFCYLYHQIRDGVVNVFMRGLLNPMGSVHPSLCVHSTAETLVSVWKNMYCAKMYKLAWLWRTAKHLQPAMIASSCCGVCSQHLKTGGFKETCSVCKERVCSRCLVTEKLSFISGSHRKRVSRLKMTFCTNCTRKAEETSALTVAMYECSDDEHWLRGPATSTSVLLSRSTCSSTRSSLSAYSM